MPFTEKRLAGPTQLTTSAVAIYTVPANRTTIVKQLVATNTSASAATFTLYIGTATAANAVFNATSVAANDSLVINLSQVLTTGEVLRALASANTAINLTISGVENDGPLTPTATYIADGAVTSAKIADGTIVNADINASAAIDKTKISGTAITAADTGTVTSTMILDGTIATADIANNAVTQAKLDTAVPLSGMRNRIINGGFDIWQRGLDLTTLGSDAYNGPDRWRTRTAAAGGSLKLTRQPSGLAGTTYCARVQRTASNNNTGALQMVQTFESVNSIPMAGQPLTFSFWARKGADYSPTSSLMTAAVVSGTGTDQYWLSFTSGAAVIDTTVTLTTSWQRFTFTATPTANASQFYIKFEMNPTGTAGTNDYFEVTGVQLETGSQVTPFEQRPYGIELALCQRYYEHNYGTGYAVGSAAAYPYNQPHTGINGYTVANQQKFLYSLYMVPKRRVPDITIYDTAGNNGKLTTLDAGGTGTTNVTVGISSTTDKMIGYAPSAGTYAGYVYFYVASAEL